MAGGEGACHCGRVRLAVPHPPAEVSQCNCSLCRTHGGLWAYYHPNQLSVTGDTIRYVRADTPTPALATHFCGHCGSTTHWTPLAPGLERVGVNINLFPAAFSAGADLRPVDGASWDL